MPVYIFQVAKRDGWIGNSKSLAMYIIGALNTHSTIALLNQNCSEITVSRVEQSYPFPERQKEETFRR
jgi:hypothetical protein